MYKSILFVLFADIRLHMAKQSAGILLYKFKDQELQVFLVHPGGPFFAKKDAGSWSIPKGEFLSDEEPLAAAKREFLEETGQAVDGNFVALKPVKQKSGKTVYAWAVEGEINHETIICNVFRIEWPPRTGKWAEFPEVDKAAWFDVAAAKLKINASQATLVDELAALLKKA